MKRYLAACVATCIVLGLCGCAPEGTAASVGSSSSQEAQSSSEALLIGDEWPDNEAANLIPAPNFSVEPETVSVIDGDVSVSYANLPEEEAAAFVQSVKDAGFTESASEGTSNKMYTYDASDASGNTVQICYVNFGESSTFSISIQAHR